ncbi:MAG: alpha/beta hydrolase fold domain-containing protein [Rhodothermales bacterium]
MTTVIPMQWLRARNAMVLLVLAGSLISKTASAQEQSVSPFTDEATPDFANISYAPAEPEDSKGHLLDLYLPENADGPVPVVIFTGGSAWFSDNTKEAARRIAPKLLAAEFAVAGVSIRSSTQAKFPAQVHDIKAAIRWLRANAGTYNFDANHIGIMGGSSGGWTSAMAAVTGDAPKLEGDLGVTSVSSAVQAAVAFYPPTNFLEMDRWAVRACKPGLEMQAGFKTGEFCHDDERSPESSLIGCSIQDCPEKTLLADPVQYITSADAPIMILHGQSDLLVPHNQGERLYMALNKACKDAVFLSLPLAGHGPVRGFLEDDTLRAGATLRTTSSAGCEATEPQLVKPSWDLLIDFLNEKLRS